MNRGRLLRDGPALLGADRTAAAALAAGVADHDVAMLAQVLECERTPEFVQRVVGMRHREEAYPHQWIAREAGGYERAYCQVDLVLHQRFFGAANHGFV